MLKAIRAMVLDDADEVPMCFFLSFERVNYSSYVKTDNLY